MDPYTRLRSRSVYRNPWVEVEVHDIVHPTGAPGEHVLIVTPQAVGVVVEDGDELIFTRQPRFGARSYVVEIVKGGTDAGETPLAAAQRELREELGIVAATWVPLGEVYEIPSIVELPVLLFAARDLTRVAPANEDVEEIASERIPIAQALRDAERGELNDAVTIAALLRWLRIRAPEVFGLA